MRAAREGVRNALRHAVRMLRGSMARRLDI